MAEEAKESAAAASPTPSSGGGKQNILLVVLAVVNMLVVGGVGFMIYKGKQAEKAKPTVDHVVQGEHQTTEHEKEEAKKITSKPIVPLETFIVNLAGSKGRRVAKVNIELEVSKLDVKNEIEGRQAQVRDIIIMILSSKTYEYVSTKEGKNQLRDEIKDTVNAFLSKGKIESVFFTEFIYN